MTLSPLPVADRACVGRLRVGDLPHRHDTRLPRRHRKALCGWPVAGRGEDRAAAAAAAAAATAGSPTQQRGAGGTQRSRALLWPPTVPALHRRCDGTRARPAGWHGGTQSNQRRSLSRAAAKDPKLYATYATLPIFGPNKLCNHLYLLYTSAEYH